MAGEEPLEHRIGAGPGVGPPPGTQLGLHARRAYGCLGRLVGVILLDEARWWFKGRRWCHLVSDESLEELHDFAEALGIPRRGFQGDHYDLPEEWRMHAIARGATVVDSRDLVRRLRSAGLRLSPDRRRAGQAEPG